jgi:2-methylcitrate dehydratase PrpD
MRRDRNGRVQMENGGVNLTRRNLLQRAAWAAAAATLPGVMGRSIALAAGDVSPVMAKLSAYMSEARNRPLPDGVVEKAKQHILDTFAAMVSGSKLPAGRVVLRFANSYGGGNSTIVCSKVLCGPIEAALVNGNLAHSDETDDSHAASLSHPGCDTIPAAYAAGEHFGAGGEQFVRAVTLGYDIGTRVTMTLGGEKGGREYQLTEHRSTHSTAGIFCATAAAACMASLNAQQMRWVLDYAAQQCSGIPVWQRDTDHIEKGFAFAGMGARSGVTAALLVQSGWTGVDDVFSGADNFFQAYEPKADPAGLIDKLGERYEVTRTNIKKWTVGSPIQAPLDALEIMRKKHPFNADQVLRVIVRSPSSEASIVNNRDIPDICLQYMVAVMLLDKTASFAAAHDKARMQDPAILRERAKIQLVPDEELDRRLPARESVVEVTLIDGTKLTERVEAVRGTAQNPMSRDEVIDKCTDLMAPVLGASTTKTFVEKIFGLEKVKDVRELRPLLQHV